MRMFGLKGDGESAGQSQGEPEAADPAGGCGAGALQEAGRVRLREGVRRHERQESRTYMHG